MKPTAILLLHCPDQQGIISEVTKFITDNQGNIVYLDQYVDKQDGMFFMRIEWELEGFLIPRDKFTTISRPCTPSVTRCAFGCTIATSARAWQSLCQR